MNIRCFAMALVALAAAPALAAPTSDPLAELDTLSRASDQVASGIALARRQIAAGELLGALATLERVLTYHPESDEALLLHASVVCRVDDGAGARIEFENISQDRVTQAGWSEAIAPCGAPATR